MEVLFFVIISCTFTASKLSFLHLIDALVLSSPNSATNITNDSELDIADDYLTEDYEQKSITIYWQLLLILIIPNIVTCLRCLFSGVFKSRKNYPWPQKTAILIVSCHFALYCIPSREMTTLLLNSCPK